MPNYQGIDNAIDRLFKRTTAEKLAEVGQPEELNPRFMGGINRVQPSTEAEGGNLSPPEVLPPTSGDSPPPPPPPWWVELFVNAPQNILGNLGSMLEKGETSAGAVLTQPWRMSESVELRNTEFAKLQQDFGKEWWKWAFPYSPGGLEYESYKKWKEEGKVPEMSVPIPSWKQLGAWLKPILKDKVDVSTWEEPTSYEMATMRLPEAAEFVPWILLGAGKTAKTALEKAADITTKQIAKGKTTEEALKIAFDKVAASQGAKVPAGFTMQAGKVKPIPATAKQRFSKEVLEKVANPKNEADDFLKNDVVATEKAIDDLTNLIKIRKPMAAQEQAALKATRVKQVQSIEEIAQSSKTSEEFIKRVSGARRGKQYRAEFRPITEAEFTPEQENLVARYIIDHPMWHNPESRNYGQLQTMSNMVISLRDKLLGRGLEKGGVSLQPHEYKLFEKLFGYDFAEALGKHKLSTKIWRNVLDGLGIPKAVRATFDFSYALRQTLPAGLGNPVQWGKEFGRQFKSFAKQEWYDDLMKNIKVNQLYKQAVKDGLEFTETGAKAALRAREETAPSKFIAYIPGIKQSARAAASIANGMRFHTYYQYKQMFGATIKDPEAWRALAMYLNAATGRGNLGEHAVTVTTYLNRFFFSPRYQVSLWQMPYYTVTQLKNPMVRQMALRFWTRFAALNLSLVGLGKASGVWDVELDPRSTDFGRVIIGDTRVDILGAYRGWANLISRLATATTKDSNGIVRPIPKDQLDDRIMQFMRGKVDPVVGAAWAWMTGKSFIGEEFPPREVKKGEAIMQETLPFAVLDVHDAYVTDGLEGAILGTSGIFGTTVSSYPSRTFDTWADWQSEIIGKQWSMAELRSVRDIFSQQQGDWIPFYELSGSKARRFWRESNPKAEAQMYFWGELQSLSTPESVKYFKELAQQYNTPEDMFPVVRPEKPEDLSDFTEEELYDKILDTLPTAYAEYLYGNPGLVKGNAETYQRFQEYRQDGLRLTRKYTNDTRGMGDIEKERYRVQNPDVDAALALWRGYSIKTSAARSVLLGMADQMGMPKELINALKPKGETGIKSSSLSIKRLTP